MIFAVMTRRCFESCHKRNIFGTPGEIPGFCYAVCDEIHGYAVKRETILLNPSNATK